jgi:6-phosphogluconolactonase
MRISVLDTPGQAAERAAALVVRALAAGGHLSLAGGGTPRRAYELLAVGGEVEWAAVDLWFGDERCVPPDDPGSNYRMVAESLLPAAAAARVHRIRGEDDPDAAAAAYAAEIAGVRLDLALLGLGEDAHTASLFPGSQALAERERLAVAVTATKPPPRRITLTFPVFEAARSVVVLAVGQGKAAAVAAVAAGRNPQHPASLLPDGRTELVIDRAAAAQLG